MLALTHTGPAIDIVHFLMSRYGIKVTEDEVRDSILGAFGECSGRRANLSSDSPNGGGSDAENGACNRDDAGCANSNGKDDCLDLTQVLALLLVPLLMKAEQSLVELQQRNANAQTPSRNRIVAFVNGDHRAGDDRWPETDLIDSVFRTMMHDATGDPSPRPLSRDLVRQVLNFYGEEECADDDRLVREMVAAANDRVENGSEDVDGEPILFDEHSFARALTHDVKRHYDIDFENRMTTNYWDALHTLRQEKNEMCLSCFASSASKDEIEEQDVNIRSVKRSFTFAAIDYTADTFRSKVCTQRVWSQ